MITNIEISQVKTKKSESELASTRSSIAPCLLLCDLLLCLPLLSNLGLHLVRLGGHLVATTLTISAWWNSVLLFMIKSVCFEVILIASFICFLGQL